MSKRILFGLKGVMVNFVLFSIWLSGKIYVLATQWNEIGVLSCWYWYFLESVGIAGLFFETVSLVKYGDYGMVLRIMRDLDTGFIGATRLLVETG